VEVWRTKDVFKPHPTQPTLWQFHGRTDDIMVLGNGEKFNPVPMEKIIEGHPLVYGALMVGQGRSQPALIVEPQDEISKGGKQPLNAILRIVQEANSKGPGHAKITRNMIAFSNGSKPFIRAGKGTIVRGRTVKAFSEEIEKLSSENNDEEVENIPDLAEPYDLRAIELFVQAAVRTYFPNNDVADHDDFFVLGVDSLQTVELAARLRVGLRAHPRVSNSDWLYMKMIYAKPTIKTLAAGIDSRLNRDGNCTSGMQGQEQENARVSRMSTIVEQYTKEILKYSSVERSKLRRSSRLTVVLTGSTGSLGAHLLEALLNDIKVARIYCFNRSQDAQERHEKNFASRGLDHTYDIGDSPLFFDVSTVFSNGWETSKVRFLKVEFGATDFGLPQATFDELTTQVDVIIHDAWKVDFLHSLESFEPVHIRGVRNFIEWSIRSERRPHIFFVSSISSVGRWATAYPGRQPVSETPHENYSVASELGYGESKHVSERILTFAAERCGAPASILRVGQIAGPLKRNGGSWHETEWLPSLVKTSKSLGLIPDSVPDINWIPVDRLATIMVELMHHGVENSIFEVYNMVNPHFASWSSLVRPIEKRFGPQARIVPFCEWLDALKEIDINDPKQTSEKPALKILDFYEALASGVGANSLTYDTRHGQAGSRTMARLPAVKASWMSTWLQQWNF
jgi:thioester reductase-like protein